MPIGTQTQTALHETDSSGVDVNPANNQDPATQTGITVTLPVGGSGTYVTDYAPSRRAARPAQSPSATTQARPPAQPTRSSTAEPRPAAASRFDVNSVAKSNPVHITSAGVTYWRAVFTGTGNSSNSTAAGTRRDPDGPSRRRP
mgnify:CR=1 FL=1